MSVKDSDWNKDAPRSSGVRDADWNGKQGGDIGRDKLRRDSSGLGYHKPVSILNRIEPSAARDDGFSAKLDKGPAEDA
jgi:hypothetical protein